MTTERVTVSAASDGAVHFTSSGAAWSLPIELCFRSTVFSQLLPPSQDDLGEERPAKAPKRDARHAPSPVNQEDHLGKAPILHDSTEGIVQPGDDSKVLNVPVGYLEAWLQLLSWDEDKKITSSTSTIAQQMQAADFFGDEQSLQAATHTLALRLHVANVDAVAPQDAFEQSTGVTSPAAATCSNNSNSVHHEVLEALPTHLVDLVFASAAATLSQKLATLPPAWHTHLITANFPSITRSSSLCLHGVEEGRWLSTSTYAALFSSIRSLTDLQELSIDCYLLRRDRATSLELLTMLAECFSGLEGLRSLSIKRASPLVPGLCSNVLWQALARLTAITSFELADAELDTDDGLAVQITAAIRMLTTLERLVIRPPASFADSSRYGAGSSIPISRYRDGPNPACFETELADAVEQLSQLTYLDLHWHAQGLFRVSRDSSGEIVSRSADLSYHPNLRHLDLSDMSRGNRKVCAVMNLSGCSGLEHLDLSYSFISETTLSEILPALPALTHLSLSLPDQIKGVAGMLACCSLHCVHLQSLQLDVGLHLEMDHEQQAGVCSSIASLKALTCLELHDRSIESQVIWCSMLTAFGNLERLVSSGDWCSQTSPICLVEGVPHLKSLTFSGVPPELIGARGWGDAFLSALAQLTQLTYLELATREVHWEDGPATALAARLSCLQSLQSLTIHGGGEFPAWMQAVHILPAISALPQLLHLRIPDCVYNESEGEESEGEGEPVDSAGLELAAALQALPSSLETLDVSGAKGCGIDFSNSVPGLVHALSRHAALTYLSLVVDSGDTVLALAGSMLDLVNIREVNIASRSVPGEAAHALCMAVQNHRRLDVLDMENAAVKFDPGSCGVQKDSLINNFPFCRL